MTFCICNIKLRMFVLALVLISVSEWIALLQPFGQWLGSCKSSKVNCVICRHACWMWRDSVVRAQMAKRRTKRPESWQGTRWISLPLVILFSKFWFSSLEPWEEEARRKWSWNCLDLQQPGFLSCPLHTWVTGLNYWSCIHSELHCYLCSAMLCCNQSMMFNLQTLAVLCQWKQQFNKQGRK